MFLLYSQAFARTFFLMWFLSFIWWSLGIQRKSFEQGRSCCMDGRKSCRGHWFQSNERATNPSLRYSIYIWSCLDNLCRFWIWFTCSSLRCRHGCVDSRRKGLLLAHYDRLFDILLNLWNSDPKSMVSSSLFTIHHLLLSS